MDTIGIKGSRHFRRPQDTTRSVILGVVVYCTYSNHHFKSLLHATGNHDSSRSRFVRRPQDMSCPLTPDSTEDDTRNSIVWGTEKKQKTVETYRVEMVRGVVGPTQLCLRPVSPSPDFPIPSNIKCDKKRDVPLGPSDSQERVTVRHDQTSYSIKSVFL